ncbi:unnamed protein product [Durusdinium trenchii]|uniref:EF-hand domain-containing protein n=1 Tax=Durusdinium trenchii TaxID=1381693 RepID=A0ABP0P8T0_9DINO
MVQCIGIISPIEIEGCSACLRMWQLFGAYRAELQADQKAQPPEDMDVRLDHGIPAEHLRCKAYVGPQAALVEGAPWPSSRIVRRKLRRMRRLKTEEFVGGSNPKAIAEIPIGAPNVSAAEPWAIRIKLQLGEARGHTPNKALPLKEKCVLPILDPLVPCDDSDVLDPGFEVLRLVPRTAVSALQAAAGEMLRRAVEAGVEGKDMEQWLGENDPSRRLQRPPRKEKRLIFGIRELGPDTISSREASHALETAARMGLRPVVELLLSAGAHATLLAARNAERAENGAEMARDDLFVAAESNKTQLLARAIEERMPLVADRLLADGLGKLETLSPEPDGLWARKAHCAGAWSVLTALLERDLAEPVGTASGEADLTLPLRGLWHNAAFAFGGDQMPCKPRLLLDYALREDTKDMDAALRTCLDHGRTEIVREALEVGEMEESDWMFAVVGIGWVKPKDLDFDYQRGYMTCPEADEQIKADLEEQDLVAIHVNEDDLPAVAVCDRFLLETMVNGKTDAVEKSLPDNDIIFVAMQHCDSFSAFFGLGADGMFHEVRVLQPEIEKYTYSAQAPKPLQDFRGANREAATLTLIDRSSVDGDKVAAVEISLFQGADQDEKLIDQAEQFQDKVIIVIGVRSKYNASKTPPLALTSSYTSKLFLAPEGAAEVKAMAAMEMQNVETQKIAAHSNAGRDWEAETYLVTCNWLRRVEGPATDHLYQVNFATLDVPVGADSIRTKDGSRIWFSSQLRDITGSVTVWVSEEAALAINSDDNLSAQLFEEAWQQRDLRFLVANVKLWAKPLIPCKLSQIVMMGHQGLGAQYVDGSDAVCRFGGLIVCFVTGAARSKLTDLGSGEAITNYCKDLLGDDGDAVYTLQTFADETRQTDYQLDKHSALVYITGQSGDKSEKVYLVEGMQILEPPVVAKARETVPKRGKAAPKRKQSSITTPDSLTKSRPLNEETPTNGFDALLVHCNEKHGNWAEHRKQLVFQAREVAAAAARELPENGVPQAFGESAVSLPEAESLQTQMPGPASRGDPLGKNEPGEEDAGCDETHEVCNFDTPSKAPQTLIGIDFMQDPKPVQHFEAMRAKLELLNKEGQKLHQLHQSESVEDVAAATGSEERCKRIVLDVQHEMKKLLRTNKHIFPDLLAKMTVSDPPPTKSDEASSRFNAQAMAVAVPTQAPLSAFDAETYPTCFVEFFYGDCAPNMCSRPNRNVSHEDIFRSLLLREELEYSVETDDPGAPYKANDKSRFDAAEFCCVFGDNVRRVKLLQSVNAAFERQGFEEDVRLISQASAADFLQANQSQDVISMANSTKTCRRVQLALRQHLGHGLNLFFGALNGFSTHNFADGYHPLLYQLTGDASLNLKRQVPLFLSRCLFLVKECIRLLNGSNFALIEPAAVNINAVEIKEPDDNGLEVSDVENNLDPDDAEEELASADDQDKVDQTQEEQNNETFAVLRTTTSLHDDWLHRGEILRPLSFIVYASRVHRVRKPAKVNADSAEIYYPFEPHYALSHLYCQQIRNRVRITRLVGCKPLEKQSQNFDNAQDETDSDADRQDSTGTVVSIDFGNGHEPVHHGNCPGEILLKVLPAAIYVQLDACELEFLPPTPCNVQIEKAKHQEGCNGLLSNISAATLKICNYHVRVLQLEKCVDQLESGLEQFHHKFRRKAETMRSFAAALLHQTWPRSSAPGAARSPPSTVSLVRRFDSLYTNPGVYVNDEGLRPSELPLSWRRKGCDGPQTGVCGHFTCLTCAEHVQDEATERFRAWRQRREPRIPKPPGPVCPLCRATFAAAVRLSDPSVDPKSFFRLACEKYAIGAIEAILPVNASTFAPIFDQLWPQWCEAPDEGMKESDFMRPDGMLAWLSSHILERKIDDQLGVPPSLQEAESWFRHFDFHGNGHLSKSELLRGIVKSYDVAQLVPQTPSRKARTVGVYKLRELVEALWDEDRWDAAGVSFDDFVGRSGLAQRLLDAFPPDARREMRRFELDRESVEEALAKARASDFQTIEEDEARAKERAEKQKRQLAPAQPPEMPVPRQRNGAQVLLASLLEAAQEESRVGATQQIHIQCPFCNAVNAARASQRHRIICGACRSVFAVPQLTGQR